MAQEYQVNRVECEMNRSGECAHRVPAIQGQAKVRIVSLLPIMRCGEKGLQAVCHIHHIAHCVGKLDKGVVGKVWVRDREADTIFTLSCAIKHKEIRGDECRQ